MGKLAAQSNASCAHAEYLTCLLVPGKYDSSLFTLFPMIGHVQGTVKSSRNDV